MLTGESGLEPTLKSNKNKKVKCIPQNIEFELKV